MSLNVIPAERQEIEQILRTHIPGRTVLAFGSRVKGTDRLVSDLDLLVLGDALSDTQRLGLITAFSDSNLPYFIDIIEDINISDEFRSAIMPSTEKLQ